MVGLKGDSIKKLDQSSKGRGENPQRLRACSFMNSKFMWRNSESCGHRLVACIDSVETLEIEIAEDNGSRES